MGSRGSRTVEYRTDPAVLERLQKLQELVEATKNQQMHAANVEAQKKLDELKEQLKKQEIEHSKRLAASEQKVSAMKVEADRVMEDAKKFIEENQIKDFAQLKKADEKRFKSILDIAARTEPIILPAKYNVVFIGSSGTGKSSLINKIVNKPDFSCAVGVAQTTREFNERPVPNSNITFFDIPGKTDKVSYLSASIIGFLKSCQFIGITVTRTIDDIADMCTLLDYINVSYVVIVTKMDQQKSSLKDMGEDNQLSGEALDLYIKTELEAAGRIVRAEVNAVCKLKDQQPIFRISSRRIEEFEWVNLISAMFQKLGPHAFLDRPIM